MFTRRDFLGLLGFVSGALTLVGKPGSAWAKKLAVPLSKAEVLKTIGGSVILKVKEQNILFARVSETEVCALDPICSHEKCTVAYNAASKQLNCPCHQSVYDLSGKVIKGPSPKPLKIFPAVLDGDRIILTVD